ncbi:MAG TPA: thiol-disulfide oxidoreductase DCC family protein [Chitinophagaceae bacterium]
MNLPSHPIIFFDGVCNLCNRSVQFVLKRDKEGIFRYASLQSASGQQILNEYSLPQDHFNSFILFDNGKIYTRSDAALRVSSQLKGWKWTRVFRIVPRFVRDAVYNLFARNRYKWFGKREECMLPKPEWKERFLP